jgi:hypothetical protein
MRDYDEKERTRKYRIDLGFMGPTCFCVVAVSQIYLDGFQLSIQISLVSFLRILAI